mgnify:CR=1 FL=1
MKLSKKQFKQDFEERLTSKFATEVFSSFDENSLVKDYPVSKEFFNTARVRDKIRTVAFFGGSQGAICINDFALKVAPKLNQMGIKIIHQTGKNDFERVNAEYKKLNINADVFDFSRDIPNKMSSADFAVSRAGASTLWELCANSLPTFFIPYKYAAGDHQYYNAKALFDKGLCFLKREEELNEEDKYKLLKRLDKEAKEDVQKLLSYEEDQIGSCMTNNYIVVRNDVTIREAMSTLVKQAGEHDNIQTLYVIDENGIFAGAIDLKDLIIAREHDNLQDIISSSYPYVYEHEKISECMEILTDYEEDSIPVLTQDKKIAGILTSSDIVELVDDEMGDDYAKLAGLTEEEDLNEPTIVSMKKRLPWLIALLFLGMAVSSVVGMFESIVAVLPIVICFQSLVLDMAGNVGTQSLAVTIRVLMDENLSGKKKIALLFKEMKIGFLNGASLAIMALVFLGVYIHLFKHYAWISSFLISGCVGISLIVAMVISSLVGTIIPMFFHKINIDPAVASGPLITTINDLVAVITYYGLSGLVLIQLFHI